MNILITARPGTGKTTLIKEIAKKLGQRASGFYTEEIRRGGQRIGFGIKTLDGKNGTLSRVDIDSPFRIGKYKVDVVEFERIALPAIEAALACTKIVIIDEIGPMELFSQKFKDSVLAALDSPSQVVATIKLKGSRFIDRIKSRSDVTLFNLRPDNRVEVLNKILGKDSLIK